MSTLFMLIGPKGSGKSHIGDLVAAQTPVHFLRVEDIWLGLQAGENGWEAVAAAVDAAFGKHEQVMVESLGAGDEFQDFYRGLAARYRMVHIRVFADPDTCIERVQTRDSARQLPTPLDKVRAYNEVAAKVRMPWDLEIDNNGPAAEAEILTAFKDLLANINM